MLYVILGAVVPLVLGLLVFVAVGYLRGTRSSTNLALAVSAGIVTAGVWVTGFLVVTFGPDSLNHGVLLLILLCMGLSYVTPKWTYELLLNLNRVSVRRDADPESPVERHRDGLLLAAVVVAAVALTLLRVLLK